ncbi:hypothetical protein JQ596_23910 [Bradyrhizobium manausense]|nr:hypothetical protein [Bradyrhizobium manausense]MBR0828586.1 hypothetical protein [Bradyrhizobium manausense]
MLNGLVAQEPKPFLRECLVACVPLLISAQIDLGFAFTASEKADHY